jgi:tetratricopeptide (TPR) repeat protein
MEKYDEAIADYRKATALDASLDYAFNNLGSVLRKKEKFDDAIDAYTQAIRANANSYIAYKTEEAPSLRKKIIKVRPKILTKL